MWNKLSLRRKLLFTGTIVAVVPMALVMTVVVKNEARMTQAAIDECGHLAYTDLDHIAQSVAQMAESHGELTAEEGYEKLRQAIMEIKVGQTGYVYVLNSRGQYVISKDGKRDGDDINMAKDADGVLFIQEIVKKAHRLQHGEMATQFYPWQNKGEDQARMKLARITYYEPWDWVIGASSYEDEFYKAEQAISGLSRQNFWMMLALAAATLLASAGGWFFISGRVNGQIEDVARTLRVASEQVTSASSEVSDSGQLMADSASGQAASLEEVNASLREIHAATQAGVQLATESDQAAGKARAAARSGVQAMGKMTGAIDDIKKSSEETARILKTIDEIAFQTNLLALNAAVEAARAGDAGKGFAVVAEEVRNLAGRSAEAAKNTAILIEESQANAGNGVVAATEVGGFLAEIADSVETVTGLVARMASTNKEQATALEEIASATEQLEGVTQGNAATAEETASASVELSQQARDVFQAVHCLNQIIKGGADSACREEKLSGSEPRTPRRPAAKRDNRPQPRPDQDQAQEVFSLEESETLEI